MQKFKYYIGPFGDQAILVQFNGTVSADLQAYITAVYQELQKLSKEGVVSLIPAFDSITVIFHPEMTSREKLELRVHGVLQKKYDASVSKSKTHKIPVCYELGLDLEHVLESKGLTFNKLVEIHTAPTYLVHFMGFVPGFMYLGGLDERLFIPRKKEPRLKIPAGAVALGREQTGVYPLETPGGWQVIGLTPHKLFSNKKGAQVKMGDKVKFESISKEEYEKLNQKNG